MNTIEIARRLAECGEKAEAQRAYTLALQAADLSPEEELEAASYLLFSKGDYRIAYTSFLSLYRRGCFQAELLELMTQAFYLPNVDSLRRRYEENCTLLARYPYLFRRDFPSFEDLPIRFYPYDDDGYLPFDRKSSVFSDYVNFRIPVVDRNFFHDLERPVLASDVYSQYQLEYLNDNVRKSEWVGRENHIYLHYSDWTTFCSHLQCLSFKKLLKEEKLVFLIGDELAQYPIDFQARFGIDYSQYPVKPVGIREVNRLIWHTQLAAHNGGDFFNEIFYGHPNLLAYSRFTIHAINQKQERMLLGSMARALKPGGKFFIEVRSVHDPLYGKGEALERNAFFYDNHYRRFLVLDELTEALRQAGFRIEYAREQTGFAPYGNDDPPVIRVVAVKN